MVFKDFLSEIKLHLSLLHIRQTTDETFNSHFVMHKFQSKMIMLVHLSRYLIKEILSQYWDLNPHTSDSRVLINY